MAIFQKTSGRLRPLTEERLGTLEELVEATAGETRFCGEAAPALQQALKERLGDKASVITTYSPAARLEALATLGEARLARGERDDLTSLQPFYLRRPSIGRINRPGISQEET